MPVYYGMFLLGSLYTQRYVCVNYYYLRLALNMFFFLSITFTLKKQRVKFYMYIYIVHTQSNIVY